MAGKLKQRSPMTGLGFFTIELDTLTAMLSNSLTYIIILEFSEATIEFKEGVNTK